MSGQPPAFDESPPPRPPSAPPPAHEPDDGLGYALEDEDSPPYPVEPDDQPPTRPCGACGAPMLASHRVCARCGMDRARGAGTSSLATHSLERGRRVLKCRHCGYDMTGIPSLVCPECGRRTSSTFASRSREKTSAEIVRRMYLKALLLILIGAGGAILFRVIFYGAPGALFTLSAYAVVVPVNLALFYACCFMWIGFDQPLHVNALNLLAAFAAADLVNALSIQLIPILVLPWIITFITYVALLADLLDIELQDAIILALITSVAQLSIQIYVLARLIA